MSLTLALARRAAVTTRRSIPSTAAVRTMARPQSRMMGGGGQPESQSMKARLWEGHSTEPEGWEGTIYTTYIVGFGLLVLALGFAPDTTIQSWANNEAQARLDLQAAGKLDKPVFGVHYNTPEQTGAASAWDDFMAKSIKPGEDDDDDDDEDDDDEDEDEDEDEEEEDDE